MKSDIKIDTTKLNNRLNRYIKNMQGHQIINVVNAMGQEAIRINIKRTLEKQVDVNGSKFERLKPKTIEARKKGQKKYSNKILVDTGRMIQSIDFIHKAKRTSAGTFATIGVGGLEIRGRVNPKEYASYHQEGTAHIPKREFLGINKSEQMQLLKIAEQLIKRILK